MNWTNVLNPMTWPPEIRNATATLVMALATAAVAVLRMDKAKPVDCDREN